jgi:hypothetical protein
MAYAEGHIEIAKWLLKIKSDIDISINNEYAFKIVCKRGHLEIAKWFSSQLPQKYIILNYNKNKIEYKIIISINISEYINVSQFAECCICYEDQIRAFSD